MGKRPRIPYVPKTNQAQQAAPKVAVAAPAKQDKTKKAQALSDIEVSCDNEILFSCKENDILEFEDKIYKERGQGYLVFKGGIEIQAIAFKIL